MSGYNERGGGTGHRKKRFTSFPSPAGKSLTKLPLGRNNPVMTSLFPLKESLVVTSRLGTGNSRTFFLRWTKSLLLQSSWSGTEQTSIILPDPDPYVAYRSGCGIGIFKIDVRDCLTKMKLIYIMVLFERFRKQNPQRGVFISQMVLHSLHNCSFLGNDRHLLFLP